MTVKTKRYQIGLSGMLVLFFCLLAACSGDDDDNDSSDNSPQFEELISFAKEELSANLVPGCAIAIIENGQLTHSTGIGVKRRGGNDPVDERTLFRVGSITKMMTAAALLTLVQEGRLDVSRPVTDYVPYLDMLDPHDPSSMTVHQSLTHTAGIPDYTLLTCDTDPDFLEQWFRDEFHDFPFWSPPGRLWNYSNLGYSLNGLIVEAVSGSPYAVALDNRIFTPAGMSSTTFDPAEIMATGNYATGHLFLSETNVLLYEPSSYDCVMSRPAGFLFSNVIDLAHFAELILAGGGSILSSQAVTSMTTPFVATHMTPEQYYGYGFMREQYKSLDVIQHGGAINGFLSYLIMVPDRNFAAIVLLNAYHYPPEIIANKALDIFLDLPDSEPPDWSTDPATWSTYTHVYNDPYVYGQFDVYQDNDLLLWVRFYDESVHEYYEFNLQQYAGDTFYFILEEINQAILVTFFLDETGSAEYFATRLGVGQRVDESDSSMTPSGFSMKKLIAAFNLDRQIPPVLPLHNMR